MSILSIIIFIYIGSCVSKLFFSYIEFENNNKFREKILKTDGNILQYLSLLIFTPGSSLLVKNQAYLKKQKVFIISEVLGIFVSLIFILSLSHLYNSEVFTISYLFHFLFFYFGLISLLYLSIFDLIYLSIPVRFTMRILFFAVIIQVFILLAKLLGITSNPILEDIGSLKNILGFLILYLGTYGLIIITKEEGIGAGDADINGFVGLMLGIPGSIIFIFVTVFTGSIV
ncbi:prepilin peptidase, partial [Candidatus Dojkabacteria bacterium]|nr:prepilin peptidase [Candidatus Dojkabacteria bacterium]